MSELGLFVGMVQQTSVSGPVIENVQRRTLVRTDAPWPAAGVISLNNEGSGWYTQGPLLDFESTEEFLTYAQVFRNGQLLQVGDFDDPTGVDLYVSVSGSNSFLYFDYPIHQNTAIVIWKYSKIT